MAIMEMLKELFEGGYHFVYEGYHGGYDVEDFEEVEDAWQEAEEDAYLIFRYEVSHERRLVAVWVDYED